jgi:hypothetical protein
MIHFVTHYQQISESEKEKILEICLNFHQYRPLELLKLLFLSAKKIHPNCKMSVLTNHSTPPLELPEEVNIIRYPYDKYGNRLAEMLSIRQFLKENPNNSNLAIVDFDMLIQESLSPLFERNFDICLSKRETRNIQHIPINLGFIGIKQGRASIAAKFFGAIIDQILPFPDLFYWGGSQLAVQKLFFHQLLKNPEIKRITYQGIQILLISEDYNYSPENSIIDTFFPHKKIIHFKGPKKKWMENYWNNHLKSK